MAPESIAVSSSYLHCRAHHWYLLHSRGFQFRRALPSHRKIRTIPQKSGKSCQIRGIFCGHWLVIKNISGSHSANAGPCGEVMQRTRGRTGVFTSGSGYGKVDV